VHTHAVERQRGARRRKVNPPALERRTVGGALDAEFRSSAQEVGELVLQSRARRPMHDDEQRRRQIGRQQWEQGHQGLDAAR
jgi:hypothetical protein